MTIVSSDHTRMHQASGCLQRNRPIRLQLAQPRREFCSRELRGTKPVRRQTSLILANFSQSETLSATSQLIFSLYLSLEQDGGLLCLYVFSLASSPQLFTTTSLSSLQPVAVWSPRQRTPSLPLSLSDCVEGVFASYQLMLAKESRKNYFRSADGDATTFKSRSERRTTTRLFNHSGRLW